MTVNSRRNAFDTAAFAQPFPVQLHLIHQGQTSSSDAMTKVGLLTTRTFILKFVALRHAIHSDADPFAFRFTLELLKREQHLTVRRPIEGVVLNFMRVTVVTNFPELIAASFERERVCTQCSSRFHICMQVLCIRFFRDGGNLNVAR
jgi:hypothetical protein